MTVPADRERLGDQILAGFNSLAVVFVVVMCVGFSAIDGADQREITAIAADHANRDARTERVKALERQRYIAFTKIDLLRMQRALYELRQDAQERKAYERKVRQRCSTHSVVATRQDVNAIAPLIPMGRRAGIARRAITTTTNRRPNTHKTPISTNKPAVNVVAHGGIEGPVQPTDRRRGHPQSGSTPAGSTTTARGGAQQEDACCSLEISSDGAATTVRTTTHATAVSTMAIAAPSSAALNSFVMPVVQPAITETSAVGPSLPPHVVDSCLPALPLIVSGDYVHCLEGDAWTLNPENNMPRLRMRAVKEDAWASYVNATSQTRITGTVVSATTPLAKSIPPVFVPIAAQGNTSSKFSLSGRATNNSVYCAILTLLPLADLRSGDLVYISNDGTRFWIVEGGFNCPPPMNIVFGVCGTYDGTPASMKGCGVTVTPPDMSAYVSGDFRPNLDWPVDPTIPPPPNTSDVTCAFIRSGPLVARAENVSLLVNGVEAKAFTVAAGEDWSAVTIARPKVEPFSLALKGADWSKPCNWLMLRQVGVAP